MNPYPMMTFGQAVQVCFNKYANFTGRASRAEYWWWYLFTFIVSAVLTWVNEYVAGLAGLALIVPTFAVAWRRMHDIGKGGGWYFINIIPLVGNIIWIVWCCRDSEDGPNRFGELENPVFMGE